MANTEIALILENIRLDPDFNYQLNQTIQTNERNEVNVKNNDDQNNDDQNHDDQNNDDEIEIKPESTKSVVIHDESSDIRTENNNNNVVERTNSNHETPNNLFQSTTDELNISVAQEQQNKNENNTADLQNNEKTIKKEKHVRFESKYSSENNDRKKKKHKIHVENPKTKRKTKSEIIVPAKYRLKKNEKENLSSSLKKESFDMDKIYVERIHYQLTEPYFEKRKEDVGDSIKKEIISPFNEDFKEPTDANDILLKINNGTYRSTKSPVHSDNIHQSFSAYYGSSKIDISDVVDKQRLVRALSQSNFPTLQNVTKSDPWKSKPPISFHTYQEWLKKVDKHASQLDLDFMNDEGNCGAENTNNDNANEKDTNDKNSKDHVTTPM